MRYNSSLARRTSGDTESPSNKTQVCKLVLEEL